ncbi:Gfo/Idh/MocA family oxidoreductase [Paracoccaceae bacterium]|nr:Gfo/Idh/MocA family oxidoreductase [Paracoccaceae bacterium]
MINNVRKFLRIALDYRQLIGSYASLALILSIKFDLAYYRFFILNHAHEKKLVIIGGGWHVKYQILPILRKIFGGEIFIVRKNQKQDLIKLFGIKYISHKNALKLDKNTTKIIIATKPELQCQFLISFLQAGFETYCEKPFFTNGDDYDVVSKVIDTCHSRFWSGMNRRHSKSFRQLFSNINNEISSFVQIINFGVPESDSLKANTNPLITLAIHAVDHALEFVANNEENYELTTTQTKGSASCKVLFENGYWFEVILLIDGDRECGWKDEILVTGRGKSLRLIDYKYLYERRGFRRYLRDNYGLEKSFCHFLNAEKKISNTRVKDQFLLRITKEILDSK